MIHAFLESSKKKKSSNCVIRLNSTANPQSNANFFFNYYLIPLRVTEVKSAYHWDLDRTAGCFNVMNEVPHLVNIQVFPYTYNNWCLLCYTVKEMFTTQWGWLKCSNNHLRSTNSFNLILFDVLCCHLMVKMTQRESCFTAGLVQLLVKSLNYWTKSVVKPHINCCKITI